MLMDDAGYGAFRHEALISRYIKNDVDFVHTGGLETSLAENVQLGQEP